MIAQPVITAEQEADLFTIESNKGFGLAPIEITGDIGAVAEAFGASPVTSVFEIRKPSPTSVLYQLDCAAAPALMVRGAAPETAEALAAQCECVSRLTDNTCIRPIPATAGTGYTVFAGDRVWIAYHRCAGDIYDGGNCAFDLLIDCVFELENALAILSATLPAKTGASLPRVSSNPAMWPDLLDTLMDDGAGSIVKGLGKTARTLLQDNRALVRKTAQTCGELAETDAVALVHNDLNHANVVIGQGEISFLDIEDIAYATPEVSVAHAIFKLLRHRVYTKHIGTAQACTEIDRVLKRLERERWDLKSRPRFFEYAAIRIFSDIELISRFAAAGDGPGLLYDLEKKIHNLFELWKIMEPSYGPATS
jgi:hypothetical protein